MDFAENSEVLALFAYQAMQAGLPSFVYVPNELTTESTNSNALFQDKKRGFSVACPVTLPKIERLPLGFNTWWLFADSSCMNRMTSVHD